MIRGPRLGADQGRRDKMTVAPAILARLAALSEEIDRYSRVGPLSDAARRRWKALGAEMDDIRRGLYEGYRAAVAPRMDILMEQVAPSLRRARQAVAALAQVRGANALQYERALSPEQRAAAVEPEPAADHEAWTHLRNAIARRYYAETAAACADYIAATVAERREFEADLDTCGFERPNSAHPMRYEHRLFPWPELWPLGPHAF